MIKFITKSKSGSEGARHLMYDIHISKGSNKRISSRADYVRIGFRNHCSDRLKDDYVALAYDDEQKSLYIIPKRTIPEDVVSSAKCYKISISNATGGHHLKTMSSELLQFIANADLFGYFDLTLDPRTGWFVVKKPEPTTKFITK